MDLSQAGLILLLDGLDLFLGVVIDLAHCLSVVFLHGLDLLLEMLDLVLLDFDLVSVVLHLLVCVGSVLVIDRGLSLMELVCFFLLLFLEFLVAGGVFEHLLVVLVAFAFKLLVLLLCKLLDGLLKFFFHLLFGNVELLVFVSVLKLHARQILLQLCDLVFLIIGAELLLEQQEALVRDQLINQHIVYGKTDFCFSKLLEMLKPDDDESFRVCLPEFYRVREAQ